MPTFHEILTAAVADLAQHGYDSNERVSGWLERLRVSALASARPQWQVDDMLRRSLGGIYHTLVERGGILRQHPGVARFTIQRLAPALRTEMERRIMMSANLIRLNRDDMIAKTLRRFSGWASSVPAGGSQVVDKVDVKKDVAKALRSLPFIERRVAIDQGAKYKAAINEVVAMDGGAIAVAWHSHWRSPGYDYREDHKERDGHVYLLRGSWAQEKGLVKPGKEGFYEDVTSVGEEVFCRCSGQYIYALRKLPDDMLTARGRSELERVKVA